MRLKFWQKPQEYYEEELKPKKKETFASVSDKILIKRMKKDDTFGIEMAMRYKGLEREKPESLQEKLKEEVELRKILKDLFGKEEAKGSFLANLIDKDTIKLALSMFAKQMGVGVEPEEAPKQLERQEIPRLAAPKPRKQKKQVDLNDLTPYLDYQPEEVIKELANKASEGDKQARQWLTFLGEQSYEGITMQLSLLAQHPQYSVIAKELLLENRKEWIEKLLELAKNIKIEEKFE